MLASACPRNTIEGHLIGVFAGYLALVVFGLQDHPATIVEGVDAQRVMAAALSLGLTSGLMVVLVRAHPPAGATTLIVSLGILRERTGRSYGRLFEAPDVVEVLTARRVT